MICNMCEYDGNCQLQVVAHDITGCTGHSKEKEMPPLRTVQEEAEKTELQPEIPGVSDFAIGDIVRADPNQYSLNSSRLPGYLAGGYLTVVGFTKSKVKCDWDGGKPFHIPPSLLRKVRE